MIGLVTNNIKWVGPTGEVAGRYTLWDTVCLVCGHKKVRSLHNRMHCNVGCQKCGGGVKIRERERNAAMVAEFLAGATLDDLATAHGMTRQRAEQIIARVVPVAEVDAALAALPHEQLINRVLGLPPHARRRILAGVGYQRNRKKKETAASGAA